MMSRMLWPIVSGIGISFVNCEETVSPSEATRCTQFHSSHKILVGEKCLSNLLEDCLGDQCKKLNEGNLGEAKRCLTVTVGNYEDLNFGQADFEKCGETVSESKKLCVLFHRVHKFNTGENCYSNVMEDCVSDLCKKSFGYEADDLKECVAGTMEYNKGLKFEQGDFEKCEETVSESQKLCVLFHRAHKANAGENCSSNLMEDCVRDQCKKKGEGEADDLKVCVSKSMVYFKGLKFEQGDFEKCEDTKSANEVKQRGGGLQVSSAVISPSAHVCATFGLAAAVVSASM